MRINGPPPQGHQQHQPGNIQNQNLGHNPENQSQYNQQVNSRFKKILQIILFYIFLIQSGTNKATRIIT